MYAIKAFEFLCQVRVTIIHYRVKLLFEEETTLGKHGHHIYIIAASTYDKECMENALSRVDVLHLL